MQEIRFHPLIDCDTVGKDKTPMFFTSDLTSVRKAHRFYLEEMVSGYYRLCSVYGCTANEAKGYTIHCPHCGKTMKVISAVADKHRLALYCCPDCKPNNNNNMEE